MFARRRDELEREANRLGALAVRGDVTNAADLERLVERRVQAFGGIDILVWNSGGPPPGTAAEITDERLEAAFELLLLPRRPARAPVPAAPASERRRPDRLHHLGRGRRSRRRTSRSRTRSARRSPAGRRRSRASSGRDGITVNCVAPGRIDTPRMTELYGDDGPPAEELAQIPLGRLGTPREFGDVVCFLASDRAALRHRDDRPGRRRQSRGRCCEAPSRPPAASSRSGSCCSRSSLALLVVPSNEYIFLPDRAHPVAPLVTVAGRPRSDARAASTSSTSSCGRRRCSSGSSAACTTAPTSTRPSADQPARRRRAAARADRPAGHAPLAADRRRGRAAGGGQEGRPAPDRRAGRRGRARQAGGREARAGRRDHRRSTAHAVRARRRTSSPRWRSTAVGDTVHFTVRRGKQTLVRSRSRPSPPTRARSRPGRRRAPRAGARHPPAVRRCGSTPATSADRRPASRSRSR